MLDLGDPFRARHGHPYVVAQRHDVLSALLDAWRAELGIYLWTGCTAAGVQEQAEHVEVIVHGVTRRPATARPAAAALRAHRIGVVDLVARTEKHRGDQVIEFLAVPHARGG
ncbi:hypothetical protein ACWEIJ_10530 [Lentzea sp. NPDC004789]